MPKSRIMITLNPQEVVALIAVAKSECRHPREQAHHFIKQELERLGLLKAGNKKHEPNKALQPSK